MGNKGSKIHPIQEVQNPLGYSTPCTLITSKKDKYYVHTYDPTTPLLLLSQRLPREIISERFVDSRRENCCNVISISLYFIGCIPDNMTKYLFSIERTVKNVHNNLPDWIVRVYIDNSVHECIKNADKNSRQKTAYNYITTAPNVEVYTYNCAVGDVQPQHIARTRTYRFLPFSDEDVNICVVREADGIVSNWDCRQIHLFSKDHTKMFYFPYNQIKRSKLSMFESYEKWLLLYKVIFRYDFFHNNYMGYDLLAGLFGIKLKLKRDFYIRTIVSLRDEIDRFITAVERNNEETYKDRGYTKYLLRNAHGWVSTPRGLLQEEPQLLSIGFDEILLLEMFKEVFSFNVSEQHLVKVSTDDDTFGDVIITDERMKDYDEIKKQIGSIVLDESTFDKKIVIDIDSPNTAIDSIIERICSKLTDEQIIHIRKRKEPMNPRINDSNGWLYFIDGQLLHKDNLIEGSGTFSITLQYGRHLDELAHLLNNPYNKVNDEFYIVSPIQPSRGGYNITKNNRNIKRNIRQYKSKHKKRRTKNNKTRSRFRGI
jgi:hypothetical protein